MRHNEEYVDICSIARQIAPPKMVLQVRLFGMCPEVSQLQNRGAK
jgi:hypothetical protein